MTKETISYLIYPAVVSLAVGIYAFSSGQGTVFSSARSEQSYLEQC